MNMNSSGGPRGEAGGGRGGVLTSCPPTQNLLISLQRKQNKVGAAQENKMDLTFHTYFSVRLRHPHSMYSCWISLYTEYSVTCTLKRG